MSLQPLQGVLVKLDDNGRIVEEKVILAQLIQRGDLLKVVPGETIPTDGRIVDGTTTCDESLITGEAMPVDKAVGAQVVGGTKNLVGLIIMKATHVGQETALKQIIKLVEDAQTSKAPIQELADKIAGVFVPFILIISFATWLVYVILGYTAFESLQQHSSVGWCRIYFDLSVSFIWIVWTIKYDKLHSKWNHIRTCLSICHHCPFRGLPVCSRFGNTNGSYGGNR